MTLICTRGSKEGTAIGRTIKTKSCSFGFWANVFLSHRSLFLAVFRSYCSVSYCSVSYCSVSVSELPDGIRKGSGVVTMPEQHQCRDHLKTLNFNSSLTAQIIQKFLASPVFAQSCPVQRMPSAVLFENRKTETEKTNKDYKN